MSADNGYLLRKNAAGDFVLQMYFASADEYPSIDRANVLTFETLEDAISYHNNHFSFDTEYGLTINIETVTYPQPESETNENEDPTDMTLELALFDRNPFQVTAAQVTEDNIDEVADWCGGRVRTPTNGEVHVKVDVRRPLNVRQTQAFVGCWVLQAGSGFKVYTDSAFRDNFTYAGEADSEAYTPLNDPETPVGRDVSQDAAPVEVGANVPQVSSSVSDPFTVDASEANS